MGEYLLDALVWQGSPKCGPLDQSISVTHRELVR